MGGHGALKEGEGMYQPHLTAEACLYRSNAVYRPSGAETLGAVEATVAPQLAKPFEICDDVGNCVYCYVAYDDRLICKFQPGSMPA